MVTINRQKRGKGDIMEAFMGCLIRGVMLMLGLLAILFIVAFMLVVMPVVFAVILLVLLIYAILS